MTIRYSNSSFLTVLDALPTDGIGWEVQSLDIGPTGTATIMQRAYRWSFLTGAKVRNDIGSGSVTIPKDDAIWTDPLPVPLTGVDPLDREFLWQIFEDGVLRHEFWGEDIFEDIATAQDAPRTVTVSGRSVDACLEWGIHVPEWAEEQTVSVDTQSPSPSGSFYLQYLDEVSDEIFYYSSAAAMQTALEAISYFDPGDIEVEINTGGGDPERIWEIRFVGQFILGNAEPADGFRVVNNTMVSDPTETPPDTRVEVRLSDITVSDAVSDPTPRTAASVFLDSLTRCQSRGVLQFLSPLFDAVDDSFGIPWADLDVHEANAGESLFSMLQRFSEAYGWEFRVLPNFQLQVVQAGFGIDQSADTRFFIGKHQISQALQRTSRELRTRTWAQSDDNFIAVSDQTSDATDLARETWVDGFSGDAGYAQVVANETQAQRQNQALQRTLVPLSGLETQDESPRIFEDYTYCDWVSVEDDRYNMYRLRVDSIAWAVASDGSPIELEVIFNGE